MGGPTRSTHGARRLRAPRISPCGFCTIDTAGEFLTFENLIAPNGVLPINTSGGNLAEGFIHGMTLVSEAVRQIQGTSPNQVPADLTSDGRPTSTARELGDLRIGGRALITAESR